VVQSHLDSYTHFANIRAKSNMLTKVVTLISLVTFVCGGYHGHGHYNFHTAWPGHHHQSAHTHVIKEPVVHVSYVKQPVVTYVTRPVKHVSFVAKPITTVTSVRQEPLLVGHAPRLVTVGHGISLGGIGPIYPAHGLGGGVGYGGSFGGYAGGHGGFGGHGHGYGHGHGHGHRHAIWISGGHGGHGYGHHGGHGW